MSRASKDEHDAAGALLNGFDYDLQVWVINGIVQRCGHPGTSCGCNGRKFGGFTLASVLACDLSGQPPATMATCPTCGEQMRPVNRPGFVHVVGANFATCRLAAALRELENNHGNA